MILLMSEKTHLVRMLRKRFQELGVAYSFVGPDVSDRFKSLYDPRVSGAVVDCEAAGMPARAWFDYLVTLGRRLPIVACGDEFQDLDGHSEYFGEPDTFTWIEKPTAEQVISTLDACGALGIRQRKLQRQSIPLFNPQTVLHAFAEKKCMSMLSVNASHFRRIAVECGNEVYYRVQDIFQSILFELWGSPGCFRSTDLLCRHSLHSNVFFIFLEGSRTSGGLPAPGALEQLADRLVSRLHNAMWDELMREGGNLLSVYLSVISGFSIGYATGLNNPCLENHELLDSLIETSASNTEVQMIRLRARQREMLQCLMVSPNALLPKYQGVFYLKKIKEEQVRQAKADNSLAPLKDAVFGFESLIRVQPQNVDAAFSRDNLVNLESRHLRPDLLFALASSHKVDVELDQACLMQGIEHSRDIPGTMMVNILPRNLYYIDKLMHFIPKNRDIIFEVSESEAVENVSLMRDVRATLGKSGLGLAADDFGKGYNSLERIMQLRPDIVKLDRSLVRDIHEDKARQGLVRGLIETAKACGSELLAEGVEEWEEAAYLQSVGIELIQGFLLHRPTEAAKILSDLDITPSEASSDTTGPQELKPSADHHDSEQEDPDDVDSVA